MSKKSQAEETMALHLKSLNIPFEREYRFYDKRKWRFDFAYPQYKFAIEVEGITHYGRNKNGSLRLGRHQTAKGFEADAIKYDKALRLGWTVYRCTPQMISMGQAIETIDLILDRLKNRPFY